MNAEAAPIEIEIEIEHVPETRITAHGEPVKRACALVVSGERERLFAPAVQPQARGRSPLGGEMRVDMAKVPEFMRPQPIVAPPDELPTYLVTKRAAKATAEEMTGFPCSTHERNHRCQIEVRFPHRSLEFEAHDWFYALGALKHYLDSRQSRV